MSNTINRDVDDKIFACLISGGEWPEELNGEFYDDILTEIRQYKFAGVTGLVTVTLPNVTAFREGAFNGCRSLESIVADKSTGAEISAFYGCSKLKTVSFPKWSSNIPNEVFYGCSGLTDCYFPLITQVSNNSFRGCVSLTSLTEDNFPKLSKTNLSSFYGCTGLTEVNLPSLTTFGNSTAFYGCTNLVTVTLPKLTYMEGGTFQNCTKLTNVSIPIVTKINDKSFAGCTALTTIEAPAATSLGKDVFSGCTSLSTISFPNVTSIGTNAFQNCPLTSLTLPKVATAAAYGIKTTTLTSASFAAATSVGKSAFQNYTALRSFSAPNVTTIGNFAFDACGLSTLEFSADITSVGICSFMPGTVIFHGDVTFVGCDPFRGRLNYVYFDKVATFTLTGTTGGYTSPGQLMYHGGSVGHFVFRSTEDFPVISHSNTLGAGIYAYVPRSMYNDYITREYWSDFYANSPERLRIIEDYTVDGTITGLLDTTKI